MSSPVRERKGGQSPLRGRPLDDKGAVGFEEAIGTFDLESVLDSMLAVQDYASTRYDPNALEETDSRRSAHSQAQCYSKANGRQPVFAFLGYEDLRTLEGRLLTIIDASYSDREQRKAVKDLIRAAIWNGWVPFLDTDDPSNGRPDGHLPHVR